MKKPIKRLLRIIMPIVAIVSFVVFVPWEIVWVWCPPLPDTVQEQVDDAIDHDLGGIIVYVDEAGKAPAVYSAGWKDRVNKVPANPKSLFKIASISKLYVATATVKLVHNQRLSLDDTLTDYLPSLIGRIENADQITLRMLLQHCSGIPDFMYDSEFPWSAYPAKLREYLELVLDEPADFEPDKRYHYSNTNYHLIGDILDKTLGYSHHRYIQEAILAPLGLTQTYSLLSEVDIREVTSGYTIDYDGDLKELNYISPAGSMIATAQDVGIFLRALNDGSLLNDSEQTIYSSIYEYEHTGLLPGYQSIARYHKDIDTVVIQFVNTSGGDMWTVSSIIYNRIIKILSHQL